MASQLGEILKRAQSWPEAARHELEQLALDIEAELARGDYRATPAELHGIDRGLQDAAAGKFASAEDVEGALRRLRDK